MPSETNVPYEESGFLAPEMSEWIKVHRRNSAPYFDLAERFNKHAHQFVNQLKVGTNYGQQLVCTSLYLRALDYFQGVILMAERGMTNDAKVLHRAQLEATFGCCAVAKDEEVMRQYVAGDVHTKKRALSKIKRNADTGANVLSTAELVELEEEIAVCQKEIDTDRPLSTNAQWLAEKAEMMPMYLSAYAYLSTAVHSGPRDVEQYLDVDAAGNVVGFVWGPDDTMVPKLLITSSETLSLALKAMETVYAVGDHATLRKELVALGGPLT